MKYIFSFSFWILLFCSCKSDRIDSIKDVLDGIAPDEQVTTIDPTKDNLLNGEKGTKIFIPANAFQFKGGSLPTEKVIVTMKEFFSISDFVSNNLSTLSDSFLLETGGMLFISAISDGKDLEINKTKSFVIAFPNKDTTKKMESFYGVTNSAGQVNWKPAFAWREEGDASSKLDETLLDSSMYKKTVSVCGWLASSLSDITWKLKHPDSTIFKYIEKKFPDTDSAVLNALCTKGLMPYMRLFINPQGKITHVDFDTEYKASTPTPPYLRKFLSDFLKSLPPFDMRTMKVYDPQDGYYLAICCHTLIDWKEYDRRFREKYSQYQDNAVEKMGAEALNYSVLSSSRLGWINCDRFLNDTTEKIDLIVNMTGATGAFAFITFDGIKSIMRGEENNGSFIFRNMPINFKIKVIGIAYQDGKPMLSKMSTIISKQPFTLSGFNEFSLKELEKQLNN